MNKQLQAMLFVTKRKEKDGTCVRDYIHVNDLAQAHILAMKDTLSMYIMHNLAKRTICEN